jgi:hypothetical protein
LCSFFHLSLNNLIIRLDEVRASGTNKSQAKNPANINFFLKKDKQAKHSSIANPKI